MNSFLVVFLAVLFVVVLWSIPFALFYSAKLWTVGCLRAKQQFEQTNSTGEKDNAKVETPTR